MLNEVPHKVLLPIKFWEKAQNKSELKQFIVMYMKKSYPDYKILKVEGQIAICEQK